MCFFKFQIQPKEECVRALTKMSNCPACQGLPEVRPCSGYCINVMKGCLAFHAELNESWGKFIGKKEYKIDNDTCLTMADQAGFYSSHPKKAKENCPITILNKANNLLLFLSER